MADDEARVLHREGDAEKRLVALSSVGAALVLVGGKLAVGLWTNSLGILSEALHSGLDLVAAAVTFWAVRVSSRPADRDHTYGHGKVENLSALFETALLLLTCTWIFYEAGHRLLGHEPVEVDASIWAFLVVIVSIVIDYSRSRALKRTAEKYDSQALEADALHFSTDIWSSAVVLVGLVCVRVSGWLGIPWLERADAVAAVGVALIVVWVSVKLGRKSVNDLLDAAPPDLPERVRSLAARVEGVWGVRKVRVRKAGPDLFADITITTEADAGLERAHDVAHRVEAAVRESMPKADVVVHVSPAEALDDDLPKKIRRIAHRHAIHAHDILVRGVEGAQVLEVHVELPAELRVDEAHEVATAFERDVLAQRPELARVVTHIEPIGRHTSMRAVDASHVRAIIEEMAEAECGGDHWRPDAIDVSHDGEELSVTFHCIVDASRTVGAAHEMTERLERALRERVPGVGRVVIHVEPGEGP